MKQLLIILFLALETFAVNKPLAVQIIDTTGSNGTRILRYKDAAIMKDVLMADDVKDLPILVYSVTGKTRGGKSFLLDLMYKYLESTQTPKGKHDWKDGKIPSIFDFKEGAESTTKGLWMSSTVFKRTLKNGTKVGIMLMDNQGLFDGEVTSGESVAMSGVSTILSYVQMFNMKEKITTNDLEQIILHLVPENVKEENASSTNLGSSLMFVVRDFMGGKKHGFGLTNGKKYIEAEQKRGTEEYQSMWAEHRSVFNKIDCVLLPHPGILVMTEEFTLFPILSDLDARFVNEIDNFLKQLFAPENMIPQSLAFTGRKIHETLLELDGKIADQSLSYFNMFIERSNQATLQFALANFTERFNTSADVFKGKGIMEGVLAESKFRGQSEKKYFAALQQKIEAIINNRVMRHLIIEYSNATKGENVTSKHELIWPEIISNMSKFLGPKEKVMEIKQETVKDISKIFYKSLAEEEAMKLETFCEDANPEEFYDRMLTLNKTVSFEKFLNSSIGKCNDFDRFGIRDSILSDIRIPEQITFGVKVKKIILRKMFKVKNFMIDRYILYLGNQDIKLKNSIIWPQIQKDIGNLVYETESEKLQNVNDITKEIASEYYKQFSKEQHKTLEDDWSKLSTGDFYDMYHQVKTFEKRQRMVMNAFPEYPPFREQGLTSIWQEEEYLLERLVELTIYQNLKNRGFSKEAESFWDGVKVFFAKVGQKIQSFFSSTVGDAYKRARSKVEDLFH